MGGGVHLPGGLWVRKGHGCPMSDTAVPSNPPQGTAKPLSRDGGTSGSTYKKGQNQQTGRRGEGRKRSEEQPKSQKKGEEVLHVPPLQATEETDMKQVFP